MDTPIWNKRPLSYPPIARPFGTLAEHSGARMGEEKSLPIMGEGFRERVCVLKVGGAVVENPESLQQLIRDFAAIEGLKVLVHGGGRSATALATQLGIETRMVEGRRITDDDMLRVVTMVYGGLVNKNIVAQLQAADVNALGLTGADMDIIRSHRRPPVPSRSLPLAPCSTIDYGWVGDVDCADGERLAALLRDGIVPVIAPLTHDGQGHLLNTNADTMAQTVACALAPFFEVTLRFAFEKRGVMRDPNDSSSLIPHITPADFDQLRADGIVSGGMLPKLENAFAAIRQGVNQVVIGETVIEAE